MIIIHILIKLLTASLSGLVSFNGIGTASISHWSSISISQDYLNRWATSTHWVSHHQYLSRRWYTFPNILLNTNDNLWSSLLDTSD